MFILLGKAFFILQGKVKLDATQFVRQLANAAPSPYDLERHGLTGEQADAFIRTFRCVKRDRPMTQPMGSSPMLELLRNWDLSMVQVGMVRFPSQRYEPPGMIGIGCVEVDPLVIQPNGEIVVYELGTNQHLLWRVARNCSTFLEALVIAAKFLGKLAISGCHDDFGSAQSVASECASVAGGERYSDFYKMLLGAE